MDNKQKRELVNQISKRMVRFHRDILTSVRSSGKDPDLWLGEREIFVDKDFKFNYNCSCIYFIDNRGIKELIENTGKLMCSCCKSRTMFQNLVTYVGSMVKDYEKFVKSESARINEQISIDEKYINSILNN